MLFFFFLLRRGRPLLIYPPNVILRFTSTFDNVQRFPPGKGTGMHFFYTSTVLTCRP